MLRKIKLYGKLAKFIGHRVLEADVATAAEAVRFLVANWPEVERHMADQHYRVSIGTYDIDLEELHHPAGAAPISFVPVVAGAGAVGRILAGIALVALSFLIIRTRIAGLAVLAVATVRPCWRQSAYPWRHRPTPNTHTKDQQRRRRPTQEL
jgi:predicted phage tail protein